MLNPIASTQIPQMSPQSNATLFFASTTFGFFALRGLVRFFAGEDFFVVVDFLVRLGELSGIERLYFSDFCRSMQILGHPCPDKFSFRKLAVLSPLARIRAGFLLGCVQFYGIVGDGFLDFLQGFDFCLADCLGRNAQCRTDFP